MLGNLNSSVRIVHAILEALPEDSKTVIFSNYTKQSQKITDFTYNSNNSDDENSEILKQSMVVAGYLGYC